MCSKEFPREGDAGDGTREVVTRFDVSESWVRRIKQERREPGKTARDRRPSWQKWSEWLRESLAEQPDICLHELQPKPESEQQAALSPQALSEACRALGLTRKTKDTDCRRTGTRRRCSETSELETTPKQHRC